VSSGELIDSVLEGGSKITRYRVDQPVYMVSFNVGQFKKIEYFSENLPTVQIYISRDKISKDGLDATGEDIGKSFHFFSSVFGPPRFKNIKVIETPFLHSQGTPGLIHLSWTTQTDGMFFNKSELSQIRAHEISHLWWGHTVKHASLKDVWIVEGLSQYCGLLYYQMKDRDFESIKKTLKAWRYDIMTGDGYYADGTKAGPIILGPRLISSKSSDYANLIYAKGAYIFHMLLYLMHDYNNGADLEFIDFLKDLVKEYSDKPITTAGLQALLEEHLQTEMTWFFDQWIYGIDIPKYSFDYKAKETDEGKYIVSCRVEQKEVADDFKMPVPLTVIFDKDRYVHLKIWVDKPLTATDLPVLPYKPKKIIFNTYDAVLCR